MTDKTPPYAVELERLADLALDPVAMGYVFSAFGWAYVIGQIPGGWLLDRFGSKRVYVLSVLLWSLVTLLQGFVGVLPAAAAVTALFSLRLLLGLAEAPSFPGNSRIVSAWFPTAERGTASAIFNSAQYFALVLFSPIMGAITYALGWRYVFLFMGAIGIGLAAWLARSIHSPREDPRVSQEELAYIEDAQRISLGHILPQFMGGEYLPKYRRHEVEIARIVLDAVTMDVYSIRARRSRNGRIHYRIVDEYEGEYEWRPKSSARPLTLGELVGLIDSIDDGNIEEGQNYLDAIRDGNADDLDAIERMTGFVTVSSPLYPELEAFYEVRAEAWAAKRRAGWLAEDGGDDEEEDA